MLCVAAILQLKRRSRLDWLPVTLAGVVVPWNVVMLIGAI
jgi:hypothetical protein